MRNNPDWLLKFLAWEAFDFSARIHFLDLAVFYPSGLYDISMMAFFHFDPPPRFPDHSALDYHLLDLLLRLFSALR